MMGKFLVLAKVQLRALLASFRVGGSRKKAVSGWTALALMAALCLFISGSYSFPLGGQLAAAGCLELLLLMMSAMAVIAGLMFTAFAAQGVVFGGRDADLLLSMPVSAFSVMLAKLTALYVENLVFCAFLVLPAGAAWLWFGGGGGVLFVLRLLIGSFFLAMLPTALSLAAGFLLSWLGGRLANRKAVSLLLYALVLAAVFYLAMNVNISMASLAAGTTGAEVEGAFTGWGIPFLLFQRGVCGDWETLVMFCLLSLAPVLLAVWLFSKNYQKVLTGLRSHGKRPAYRLGRLRASGRRKALLRKEADRYFGTPIYLLNTGIGLILLVVAGIAAAVMGGSLRDRLAQAGAAAAIRDEGYFQSIRRRVTDTRERTAQALKEIGFTVLPSQANFLFVRHPDRPGKALFDGLRERGVLVRRWDIPEIQDWLRISVGTDADMDALVRALNEL